MESAFIGTPTMNFFAGRVEAGSFRCAGASLEVGPVVPDGDAVLGIRPEDVVVDPGAPLLAEAPVDLVEPMGHETIVHFEVDGQSAVARLGSEVRASPGDRLRLGARPGKWHVFEAREKGARLA